MSIDDKRGLRTRDRRSDRTGLLTRMCAQAPQRGCESHRVHQIADQ